MLRSTFRRFGEPVIVACGASVSEDGVLHAPLLFVRAELDARPYTLSDVESGKRVVVTLPDDYLSLQKDKCIQNAQLKVTKARQ